MINKPQLTLSDRVQIELGILSGKSFKQIAKIIEKSPKTVSLELRRNRSRIEGTLMYHNDCKNSLKCNIKTLCGICPFNHYRICARCGFEKCTSICPHYVPRSCAKLERPPYVCNICPQRTKCTNTRYLYSAKNAQQLADKRRSVSRQGIRLTEEEFKHLDELLSTCIDKGQPLIHMYSEHKDEIPITLRSLYYYIDAGKMTVKNIDLRRKVKYKQRKKHQKPLKYKEPSFRAGRSYDDYNWKMRQQPNASVVQMDTVKGKMHSGQCLLTMLFVDTNVMLIFLLPNCRADSVIKIFDVLSNSLGVERFNRLFRVVLTDNGSEFKDALRLENTEDGEHRCDVFYCDPQASWQKAEIEKNHEYIRYVLPKGTSFATLTGLQVNKLMNHINSTKRKSLGGKSPYELVSNKDDDFLNLMAILKMDIIPSDDVLLTPKLLK